MPVMKNYTFLFTFSMVMIFFSCTSPEKQVQDSDQFIEGNGGRNYGGVFRLNESEYIKNLFPHNITDAYSYRVASQIYEGLFRFDPETLEVTNGLVESFEVNDSG